MALSDTGPGGSALLVMGVGGKLAVYNVSSSTQNWDYNFGTSATVDSVAISNDGTAIAAVASIPGVGSYPPYYTFVYFSDGTRENTWNSSAYSTPVDVSMDIDGTRVIVGEDTSTAAAAVMLFDPPTGAPTTWNPKSTVGNSYDLAGAQISGDGSSMFEISQEGFAATTVAHPDDTTAMEALSSASMFSVSYTGCQVLIGMGTSASYYDVSGQQASSCANASFAQPMWQATFQSNIYALSLAINNPSYFVVAWGSEIQWYYAYSGMPGGDQIAYRTVTTSGAIDSAALSSTGRVVAVGSAFLVGGGSEFMLAADVGVPPPAALVITATQVQGSSGAANAQETISWSAPPSASFTQINITIALDGASGSVPTVNPIVQSSPTSYTVSGLSFSTAYTVTVTLVVYGGAGRTTSAAVPFTTAGVPPTQDPFGAFEILSIALIVAAIVMYVVVASRLPKREETPAPTASPRPYYRPPPPSSPPQQGAT
jgi:hypothetical protein